MWWVAEPGASGEGAQPGSSQGLHTGGARPGLGSCAGGRCIFQSQGLGALNIWRRMWLLPLKLTADEKQLLETIFDARHVSFIPS